MNFKNYLILKNNLYRVVKDSKFDKSYIQAIIKEFTKKGLNVNKINGVFNDYISLDDLSDYELMAFTKGTYNYTHDKLFLLNENFSPKNIEGFQLFSREEDDINEVKLTNIIKIDDFNYLGRISFEELEKYINSNLIIYDKTTQRASKIKNIGTKGGYIRDISLNMKSVKEMERLMEQKKFEENEIILSITLEEENEPNINFIPKFENMFGDLIITPEYFDIKHKTVVIVLDGYHRIKSGIEAFIRSGRSLKGGLDVRVVIRTKEEQKRVIYQTFKRSDTDKEHLESYNIDDDYYKFITNVCDNSEILRNNVSETYEDCLVDETLTYKTLLMGMLKYINVKVDSLNAKKVLSYKYAKTLDDIINNFENKIINPRIYAYYILFVNKIIEGELNEHDVNIILEKNIDKLKYYTKKNVKNISYNEIVKNVVEMIGVYKND